MIKLRFSCKRGRRGRGAWWVVEEGGWGEQSSTKDRSVVVQAEAGQNSHLQCAQARCPARAVIKPIIPMIMLGGQPISCFGTLPARYTLSPVVCMVVCLPSPSKLLQPLRGLRQRCQIICHLRLIAPWRVRDTEVSQPKN